MKLGKFKRRTRCRACNSSHINEILDLGVMPLAGGFLEREEFESEEAYPLTLHLCMECNLLQVMNVVSAETLFTDYKYRSSTTQTLRNHFKAYAQELFENCYLRSSDLAVEIGCNDGVFLKPLNDLGANAVGVDPATNLAEIARAKELKVLNCYFTKSVALDIIRMEDRNAQVVLGSNVFAHIDNMEEVMNGVCLLLTKQGVFSFEVHYLVDLISNLQYDMIYHEHLCYWSLTALKSFLEKHNLRIFDVKRMPMHAGSIRVYACKEKAFYKKSPRVGELFDIEESMKLKDLETYLHFGYKIEKHKNLLLNILKGFKDSGKSIAGYGAPGRGNTMLCYCGINTSILDFLVDASPARYDLYTPGTHIPIYPPQKFRDDPPDVALMLAWSYEKEILGKEQWFMKEGRKWIIPFPEPIVI